MQMSSFGVKRKATFFIIAVVSEKKAFWLANVSLETIFLQPKSCNHLLIHGLQET